MVIDRRDVKGDRKSGVGGLLWWKYADTRLLEVFSALYALYWGVVLAMYPFWGLSSPPALSLEALAPHFQWSLLFLFVWIIQSSAMCGNIWLLRYPAALLSMSIWLFVAITYMINSPLSPQIGSHLLLGLGMMWVVVRGPTDGRR